MAINLGSTAIADVKLGTTQVEKIYLGSTQVWGGSPAPVDPQYGEVVLYGYTEVETNISNVTGGTVTVTDDDTFKMTFSGEMSGTTYALPINVTITGSDPSNYFDWVVSGTDANGTPIQVEMMFMDPGMSISGVSGSFTVSFRINTFKNLTIDKTTTTTRTLTSVSQFNQLGSSDSYATHVLGNVPKQAVKSVKIGYTPTSIPDNFLRSCYNLESLSFSSNNNIRTIGNYFLSSISSTYTTLAQIDLPSPINTIGDHFLYSTSAYNHPITLPSSVQQIGEYFLASNSQLNSSVTLSANLINIPGNFMSGDTKFNQPIVIPESVGNIQTAFLSGCTAFNSPITLSSSMTSIGSNFLNNCFKFNQDITLPSTITSVGATFMSNLGDMVGTVNIGTLPATVFVTGNYTLNARNNSSAAYTTGVTIKGTNRAAFIARFPDRTSSPYRKLIDGGA